MEKNSGSSLIEIILAISLFVIFSSGIVFVVLQGLDTTRLSTEITVAKEYAVEGIEAMRSIKNQSFSALVNTAGTGLKQNADGTWVFDGTDNTFDKYTRTLIVSDARRDINGNIVETGGTIDPSSKKVISEVTWNVNAARADSIDLTNYFTDWEAPIVPFLPISGMLVYGDGGTTSDAIRYKILNGTTGIWSAPSNTTDIDTGSSNKALRAARVYASPNRNEKIVISRHYNGSSQFVYAQVFDGTSWGNVILLSSWNSDSFLDVRNFDGTYLQNGDFMTVYSDNSAIPKFRVWDGTSWTSQMATQNIGSIPVYIVPRNRPNTNEVMAAFYDQSRDVNTEYFNGTAYLAANWTLHPEHSAAASLPNTKELIDFEWSRNNPLLGIFIYANRNNDRSITGRIWTANGTGGGIWTTNANATNQSKLGAMAASSRRTLNEYIACDKDNNNDIYCFRGNTSPSWTTPSNNILTLTTDNGIQRSFDIGFEATSDQTAIAVYSDLTGIPKLKKYSASSNSWDQTATSLNALNASLETVVLIPQESSDDIMILVADNNRRLYSLVWDGTNDLIYTTPSGRAFSTHGTNGSSATNFWYDFVWDKF